MDRDEFFVRVPFHEAVPFLPGIGIVVGTDRIGFFTHGQGLLSGMISKNRLSVRDKRLVD
jgi:hypothetical protein